MIREFKSVIKNPNFMYLWVSQILSQLAINILNFLLLTYLYSVTGSPIATSFLWIAFSLPAILIGPIGAAMVDLVDRRKMLMATNLLQALTIFLFIFIYSQTVFVVYVIVFLYSALNQFYVPAESAVLPSVAGKNALSKANSLFFITMQASVVLGFGIGGLLQNLLGFNNTFILAGIFLFIAFVSVSFLPPTKPVKKISGEFGRDIKTFFTTILEGYEFISKNKNILIPILLLLSIQAGLAIIITNLPSLATEVLNVSADLSGISIVVPAGIGAFLGSIYLPRFSKKIWRKKTIVEMSLALVSLALLAIGVAVTFLPFGLRIGLTSILIMLIGMAFVGINIPIITFLQENTPDWFRGRVFGNLWFLVTIVNVVPVLFSGAITELFGVRTLLTIMALGGFAMLFYSAKKGQSLIEEHFT
jgi:MFS family permease